MDPTLGMELDAHAFLLGHNALVSGQDPQLGYFDEANLDEYLLNDIGELTSRLSIACFRGVWRWLKTEVL